MAGSGKRLFSNEELAEMRIVFPGMAQRDVLNAYRELRTQLMQRAGRRHFVVIVSSLAEHHGSDTVAMNIAASIAFDEQHHALYIDCNLEQPRGERLIQHKPRHGLSEYLVDGGIAADDIVYESGIPRLSVVPVGAPRSTAVEYLSSPRMSELLDYLKGQAPRFIVIDVPPVEQSVVARIVAPMADQAVLAVPFGTVNVTQIMSGVDAVGQQRLAGLVFAY